VTERQAHAIVRRAAFGYTATRDDGPTHARTDCARLSLDEASAVFARNSVATVTYALDDGRMRVTRERYAYSRCALYIPASAHLSALFNSSMERAIECDVSEIEGMSQWRYAWLRGGSVLLQPTGGALEREEWREGIEQIRRVVSGLPATEELRFANFGIVRVKELRFYGTRVPLGEA
jgi:hypothetical protein